MSSGKLVLVCRRTGEQLPIEQIRKHGYECAIVRELTAKEYFLPLKPDQAPPAVPRGLQPAEIDAFYDDLIGRVIRDCLGTDPS